MRILLIDSSPYMYSKATSELFIHGYYMEYADCLNTIYQINANFMPHFIVADIEFLVKNGMETISKLRKKKL